MKYPKFIQKGNCIGVPTPSASGGEKLSNQRLLQAEKYFLSQGFELVLSKNLFSCQMGRSASAQDRAKEINDMFSSDDVDCILCCDGGDFLVEILPFVDFSLLVSHPKFVVGFSDPTGLLYPITTKYDIATIYGHNYSNFGALELHQSELNFLEFLTGNLILQESYDMYQNEFVPRVTGLEGYHLIKKCIGILWMKRLYIYMVGSLVDVSILLLNLLERNMMAFKNFIDAIQRMASFGILIIVNLQWKRRFECCGNFRS